MSYRTIVSTLLVGCCFLLLSGCGGGGAATTNTEPEVAVPAPAPVTKVMVEGVVFSEPFGLENSYSITFSNNVDSTTSTVDTEETTAFSALLLPSTYKLEIQNKNQEIIFEQQSVVVNSEGKMVGFEDNQYVNKILIVHTSDYVNRYCPKCNDAKDSARYELPPLLLEYETQPDSYNNQAIMINFANAIETSLLVQGEGCGELHSEVVTGGVYTQRGKVGRKGECSIEATFKTDSGDVQYSRNFLVNLTDFSLPSIYVADISEGSIERSLYFPDQELKPASNSIDGLGIDNIASADFIANGSLTSFEISLNDPSLFKESDLNDVIRRVYVKIDNVEGIFYAPFYLKDNKVIVDIFMENDFFVNQNSLGATKLKSNELGNVFNISIQLEDSNGNFSNIVSKQLSSKIVADGTVQISISWDKPVDIDLHVIDPNNDEIYFANRSTANGGTLDLDSNASCQVDNINKENVSWPKAGSSPTTGEYIVKAAYYQACNSYTGTVNYTAVTTVCGKKNTIKGTFNLADVKEQGAGAGVEITRISYNGLPCDQYIVKGKAEYEDFAPSSTLGLSSTLSKKPIREAKIQVIRKVDGQVVGTEKTDANGNFDFQFTNSGDAVYNVVIKTEQNNTKVKQKVVPVGGSDAYQLKSADIDGIVDRQKSNLNLLAKKNVNAEAFNIFEMGLKGAEFIKATYNKTPPMLTWEWTFGTVSFCGSTASCYSSSNKKIGVLSKTSDEDGYDDFVLMHEFGHFFSDEYSNEDSPGGSHSSSNRIVPKLAWSEGHATFFGNTVLKNSVYIDAFLSSTGTPKAFLLDIEKLPSKVPLGTIASTSILGNLSEALVSAMLWDLSDSTNELKDTLSKKQNVFDVSSKYLNDPDKYVLTDGIFGGLFTSQTDRGVAGPDFVDFLDGWFCLGFGNKGVVSSPAVPPVPATPTTPAIPAVPAVLASGVNGIVNDLHQFPYDYPTLASCK